MEYQVLKNHFDNYNNKVYNVGIYCRLSVDDGVMLSESVSIANQKRIITKYVEEKGWNIYDIYADDGYSGTNFDRPEFQRMLLDIEKGNMFMIPRGFAHGFVVLSEVATFAYKCDELYHPEDEGGIMWNDPEIGIIWPYIGEIILSEKDKVHSSLKDSKIKF